MHPQLQRAVTELGIDVPIYRVEEQDRILVIYCYGGRVVRWPPSTMATAGEGASRCAPTGDGVLAGLTTSPSPVEDFTAIPYVGRATAQALHAAGFRTFRDLILATDTDLLDVPKVNPLILSKIRDYLANHYTQ